MGRRIPWRNIGMERGSQTLAYPKSWPCNFDCILIQLNLLRYQSEAGQSFRQPAKLLLSYRPVMRGNIKVTLFRVLCSSARAL